VTVILIRREQFFVSKVTHNQLAATMVVDTALATALAQTQLDRNSNKQRVVMDMSKSKWHRVMETTSRRSGGKR